MGGEDERFRHVEYGLSKARYGTTNGGTLVSKADVST